MVPVWMPCERRHAELIDVDVDLMRVEAVRVDGGVGAESDFDTGFDGLDGVLLFDGADVLHLLLVEGREIAVLLHPVDEVGGGDEVGAVLLHHGDAFVVEVGAVLDGVDAGLAGPEDALCAVGVGGDLAAEAVSVGDDGLHLFEGVLGGLRVVALGEDAAGGSDLDEVGAVLDVFADLMLDGGDAVGYALAVDVVLVGEKVLVHVAAGDAERGAGDLHVRAGDVAGVDLVAESDVGVVVGADVADGGEAGFERDLGVFDADDGLFGGSHREFEVGVEVVGHGEVGVDVDEAGHDGVSREVDLGVAGLLRCGGRRGDRGDAVAGDDDGLGGGFGAGFDVEDDGRCG